MEAHPASAWSGAEKEDTYSVPMALLATALSIKDDGHVLAAPLKANLHRNHPKPQCQLFELSAMSLPCVILSLEGPRHLGNTINELPAE